MAAKVAHSEQLFRIIVLIKSRDTLTEHNHIKSLLYILRWTVENIQNYSY